MDRKFAFLGDHTEDGFIVHDREEVRQCLLDLEGAVFQLGGIVTMSSIREQIAPDQYATTGVLIKYDSFAPARQIERDPEEVAEP